MKILSRKIGRKLHRVLVELPPCRRILYDGMTPYFLSLPTSRFSIGYRIIQLENGRSKFRTHSLKFCFVGESNKTLVPPFYNMYENLEVCCDKVESHTLESMIQEQIGLFFASEFNNDLSSAINEHYRRNTQADLHELLNWEIWQRKTKENPQWIPTDFPVFKRKFWVEALKEIK